VSGLPGGPLGAAWRGALADPQVVHLDAAGCACPSRAVLDATVGYLRREAEIGGYPAEVEAHDAVARLRGRLGDLVGLDADAVALVPNATLAFTALLGAWPLPAGARVGVLGSEYESNRLALEALADRGGVTLERLPTDEHGRLRLEGLAGLLHRGLHLVTFPVVASHRGVIQPAAEAVALAHGAGVPVALDVAQAAGHVPLDRLGADAYVGTGRKWLRGPRGTGWVAAAPEMGGRLEPEYPSLTGRDKAGVARLATGEASIAARVGWGVALDELAAAEPDVVFTRIAALGRLARARLDGVGGWRAKEPLDEPSGIVTLAHLEEDPVVRAAGLFAEGITTTAIPARRAPADLTSGVLRISLHAYCDEGDLDRLEFSLRR
jgi:pyridoxal 5-phosphate dependent beta-lyase